jgi:hypothetical protein
MLDHVRFRGKSLVELTGGLWPTAAGPHLRPSALKPAAVRSRGAALDTLPDRRRSEPPLPTLDALAAVRVGRRRGWVHIKTESAGAVTDRNYCVEPSAG